MDLRTAAIGMPLHGTGQASDPARIDQAARQLEGAFAQLLVGAMRQAGGSLGGGDSLFGDQGGHFRDMYDQQLARSLSEGRGLGLQDSIRRQLAGPQAAATATDANGMHGLGAGAPAVPFSLHGYLRPTAAEPMALPGARNAQASDDWQAAAERASALREAALARREALAARAPSPSASSQAASRLREAAAGQHSPEAFVAEIWPHAQKAAQELGVCARTLVAQVALETGWGRSTMRRDGGGAANNYFGIKATGGWQGDRATHRTQEFSGGRMQDEVASFRAYASPAESFADYVRLLKTSPRYSEAVNSGGDGRRFAQSLQRAGYATDPQYAAKLTAIAEGPTLRRALAQLDGGATPATRA